MRNLARLILALSLLLPLECLSQTVETVIARFDRLEAKIEVGLNRTQYLSEVGELNADMRALKGTQAIKARPEAFRLLEKALGDHLIAAQLWSMPEGLRQEFTQYSKVGEGLARDYPEINDSFAKGGGIIGDVFRVQYVIPVIWRYAARRVAEAKTVQ
jgi:hypothetical protein